MDKKGIIREHSKIKLELYKLYLQGYLSVLLVTPIFKNIEIYDIFAGCGISDNDEEGSSIIAAKTMNEVKTNNRHNKTIALKLNEHDEKSCNKLKKHLNDYNFASVSCNDANEYLNSWSSERDTHNLFFIDPHGYTQIETKNLERLFKTRNCDFLIFVPLSHIYRFLKPPEMKKSTTEHQETQLLPSNLEINNADKTKYYEPIAKFFEGLNITHKTLLSINSVDEFTDKVIETFSKLSNSDFVYHQGLSNETGNNKYALFFISHNILGAQKFLEAQKKMVENEASRSLSGTLFENNIDPKNLPMSFIGNTPSIERFLDKELRYDNVKLYEIGIKNGILPSELKQQLKALEGDGKLKVTECPGKKRNSRGFYISYNHYKNKNSIVTINFTK